MKLSASAYIFRSRSCSASTRAYSCSRISFSFTASASVYFSPCTFVIDSSATTSSSAVTLGFLMAHSARRNLCSASPMWYSLRTASFSSALRPKNPPDSAILVSQMPTGREFIGIAMNGLSFVACACSIRVISAGSLRSILVAIVLSVFLSRVCPASPLCRSTRAPVRLFLKVIFAERGLYDYRLRCLAHFHSLCLNVRVLTFSLRRHLPCR